MEKYPTPQMGTNGQVVGKRVLAFVVDSLLLGIAYAVIVGILVAIGDVGLAMLFGWFVAPVLGFAYFIVLEGLYGCTPGKHLLGLVVVKSDGKNMTLGSSAIRNLLLIVDSLPFFYLLGIVMLFVTNENQRVGDLAADTVVVSQR
ncbi:RDD family protein [Natrarchaeobaculum aegyptiacum]|uniref:Transporter n=1 Tax=Natrarchaeobaculum aegyptiacum TaxID=745377 RepID=A0A2Z2HZ54_9EURY|nr:RDD family protein [Natrarchaeobaculum aegyptiacum]ARS90474.1 transporter [Natrarchaeobaculum aegyptiacum]